MKGREKNMTEIRNIIHRLRLNQSIRCIHRELGVHRSIIRALYHLAVQHQWLDPTLPMPSDEVIANARIPQTKTQRPHSLDVHYEQIKQWDKEGLSSTVVCQLLHEKCPCDVQAIRRYRSKHFQKPIEPVMVRSTVPGQDLDLDFGELGKFLNDHGKIKRVWVFSLRLRHSRRAYREIVLDQKIPTFLMGHVHAFEFFNGVPLHCIPDNLKAAVVYSSVDNDGINRSYQELAEHYGFIVAPCLPRTPEHKGGVEGDIKYVKRNFLPAFRARQREQGIDMPTINNLVEALKKWENEVADVHLIHGIGRSPLELFTSEEQKVLQPLPKKRFEPATWHQCEVRRDWRVMIESAYYSVPYGLIGEMVEVRMTYSWVRIFHKNHEVALHERAMEKWSYQRKAEHAPPFKEAVLQCSREGLLILSQEIGSFTHEAVLSILSHPSVDKLKPVRHLLRLAEKYSKQRLEKACERATICKTFSYKSIKTILENGLDSQPIESSKSKVIPLPRFRFARNSEDYKSTTSTRRPETFDAKIARFHSVSKYGNALAGGLATLLADQVIEEHNTEARPK